MESLLNRIKQLEEKVEELGNLVGIQWSQQDVESDENCDINMSKPHNYWSRAKKDNEEDADDSDDQNCYVIHSPGKGNKQDLYLIDDLESEAQDEWTVKLSSARKYWEVKEAEDDCRFLKSPDKWHRKPTVLEIENE